MMKWKVVRNPRCASADRSLDCFKNSASLQFGNNDSNNNEKQGRSDGLCKESDKQQDHLLSRKPSLVKSDYISFRNFLGLTRQRSEINLSDLGLFNREQRRSHSEVRGVSCDRLTVGYHHTPSIGPPPANLVNTKTRSSSPTNKSGCWLRGRKRERDVRNVPKSNVEIAGKTVVTGSTRKQSASFSDYRTIADQINGKSGNGGRNSSKDNRNSKTKKGKSEKVAEEVVYAEIGRNNPSSKLLNLKRDTSKEPGKRNRKKGLAPQVPSAPVKELSTDVNLNPNGAVNVVPSCFNEKTKSSPRVKPPRKVNMSNSKNIINHNSSIIPSDEVNNLRNSPDIKKGITNPSKKVVAVAEIHNNAVGENVDEDKKKKQPTSSFIPNGKSECSKSFSEINLDSKKNAIQTKVKRVPDNKNKTETPENCSTNDKEANEEKENYQEEKIEIPAFRIDTPDYSTLESEIGESLNQISNDIASKPNLNDSMSTDSMDNDYKTLKELKSIILSDIEKSMMDLNLPSILRGSATDIRGPDSEYSHKKSVRFEKLGLIEKYRKNKNDSLKDTDEESDISSVSNKTDSKQTLDVNSNEISTSETESLLKQSLGYFSSETLDKTSSSECPSECSLSSPVQKECPHNGMTVNVLVKNPSPRMSRCIVNSQTDDSHGQLVVKKSFVLTIAKQERGFKSLCANKKPEAASSDHSKKDHKISVTFLCSNNAPNDSCNNSVLNALRLRSLSVPPQMQPEIEPPPMPPPMRGRSRERRSKERSHHKKTHKSKKKEIAFHMPQAVIDELSQVLEKRKPSPDGILAT